MKLPLTDRLPFSDNSDPGVVLELDLSQGVVLGPPANPLEAWQLRHAPTLRDIRAGLKRGRKDDGVHGLLIHIGSAPITLAVADELAELVAEFSADKPSVAWTESFGEVTGGLPGYRVAAQAGQIWLQPSGGWSVTGVELSIMLLRGGLEKLGIEPQFGKRKEFKSAADQFAATEVSEANREMMQRIADSIVDDTVSRVADARDMSAEDVRTAIDSAPLNAAAALEAGLVDRLGYRDEVYAWAKQEWRAPDQNDDWAPIYVHRYKRESLGEQLKAVRDRKEPGIAVVDIRGPIVWGVQSSPNQAASEPVTARLREVGRDDRVQAVVLRVDSPGGSAIASDAMHHEVQRLRESGRPVVAAMGSAAASGGYFVSMGANEIVALPSTLTGSIGVLAGKMVLSGLFDKIDIVRESITSGANAAFMSPDSEFSEDHWARLDTWLDEIYEDFTTKAAADRGMELSELEPLARGRVWTGVDALERGLVDHLGGYSTALERAAVLAEIDPAEARILTAPPWNILKELKPAMSSESASTGAVLPPRGLEGLLLRAASAAGIELPHGALSLPWDIRLDG